MKKEFLFFFLLLIISVFYIVRYIVFGKQGSEINSILGGAIIFILTLPWIGIAFLKKIPNKRLWFFLALSCIFNVGVNHLYSFFSKHDFHFNILVDLYLATIPNALYFFALANLFAAILEKPALDNRSGILYKKLRLLPLIYVVFGVSYGLVVGLFLNDILKDPNKIQILFLSSAASCAILAVSFFYVLLRVPDSTIEFFLKKSERLPVSAANKYFVLILVLYIVLSGFFEIGRRHWLFWLFHAVGFLLLLGGQWRFIRHLFMQPKFVSSIEVDETLVAVTNKKFLFYNCLAFGIIFPIVIGATHFFK